MALHIDYYASRNSPRTHLGAARIEAMAQDRLEFVQRRLAHG
jgi:hypothetical protein